MRTRKSYLFTGYLTAGVPSAVSEGAALRSHGDGEGETNFILSQLMCGDGEGETYFNLSELASLVSSMGKS